tara:strand:- start:2549 stop:3193 length:645 start_codon:yes stop_codon:yes gene_type:complete
MLSFLLGLGLGSAALVMAGYLNIWKLNWQAAYAIVDSRLYLPQTQTVILPTTPLALIPILYNASPEKLVLDKENSAEASYIPKEGPFAPTTAQTSALTGNQNETMTPAESILQKLQTTAQACPDVGTVYWDNCYGIFKAPWNVTYEGVWREDKLQGFGRSVNLTSGETYLGEFINNMFEGCGVLTSQNGERQQGIWEKNILISSDETCLLSKGD